VVKLPRNVSPAAAARRSLLVDALIGLAVAVAATVIAAGIGVVGFFALICAAVIVTWYLIEGGIRATRRRRPPR
jgi:NhaP-type Na+/H+ or K+/H+ antiporter